MQRDRFGAFPESSGNLNDDRAVVGDLFACRIVHAHFQVAVGAVIYTGQVRDHILVIGVDGAGVLLAALHVLGIVTAQHFDRITGVRGAGAEQVVQIAHHAGHAGGAVHVFVEDGFNTLALIGAQVPIAAAGVKHAGSSIQFHLVHIRVPVAGKVLDGCPIGGQGDVLDQHIAAIQRIPVTAAVLECGQHFICVGAADAPDKVGILLSTLIGGTYLALFAL